MAVKIWDDARVRVIAIDRPDARGAVDPATARALYDAFRAFDADDAVDVGILAGTGGCFCAGFDLKTAADGSAESWIAQLDIPEGWSDPMGDPLRGPMGPSRLMLTKPVIAAIEGHAVAGGMELALWCDLRIMAEDALSGVFCRRWGVPLIDGGTVRLPRVVGQGRANDLILSGRAMYADEALAMGFANRVVPAGTALRVAMDYAQDLVRYPTSCMRADHLSARMAPEILAKALRREWQSAPVFFAEGQHGAARFSAGKGRGGDFGAI